MSYSKAQLDDSLGPFVVGALVGVSRQSPRRRIASLISFTKGMAQWCVFEARLDDSASN